MNAFHIIIQAVLSLRSSGRLAVILGYDAVALNESYQSDSLMLLLNRSKVMVQDTGISFANGQKSGVGV